MHMQIALQLWSLKVTAVAKYSEKQTCGHYQTHFNQSSLGRQHHYKHSKLDISKCIITSSLYAKVKTTAKLQKFKWHNSWNEFTCNNGFCRMACKRASDGNPEQSWFLEDFVTAKLYRVCRYFLCYLVFTTRGGQIPGQAYVGCQPSCHGFGQYLVSGVIDASKFTGANSSPLRPKLFEIWGQVYMRSSLKTFFKSFFFSVTYF